ncbi:MAG: putative acetyltransferase [Mariniflexile sp.]|jgi:putative acetyltransferase
MIALIRTDSGNADFVKLVHQLNEYLKMMDGEEHAFYSQYNGIESLKNVIVAYVNSEPVGCGAFKKFDDNRVEIKRMYTASEHRGIRVASKILKELESWSQEMSYSTSILETGKRQIEAVQFYKKNNYKIITNYGQYLGKENSLCFKKELV